MEEIDLKQMLTLIWRRKFLIIILMIFGAICGYIYNNNLTTPIYQASTTVILSVKEDKNIASEEETVTNDDIKLSENLMDTYEKIIKSNSVASTIKENLNLNLSEQNISKSISLKNESNTMVLEIVVSNENPETASLIASEVPNVFFEKIEGVYNIKNAEVLDTVKKPTTPSNINPPKYAAIGLIIGIIISGIIICIETLLDEKIKSETEIQQKLKLPVIAQLGLIAEKEKNVIYDNNSACSETFRFLLSNIKFLKAKIILVTSCSPAEGKSFISSNMAITYAKSGKKTLLIDSDIRRGRQHNIFNINQPKEGISNLIQDQPKNIDLKRYITHSNIVENLDIITRGTALIDYSKLLYTTAIEQLIDLAKTKYDFIIIDGTPKSLVADDIALSSVVDCTLLVVRYNKTTISDVKKIKQSIKRNGIKNLGVVLNGMPSVNKKYQYSYYKYNNSNQLVVKKIKKVNEVTRSIAKSSNSGKLL